MARPKFITLLAAASRAARDLRPGDDIPECVLDRIVDAMVEGRIKVRVWAKWNPIENVEAYRVEVPKDLQPEDLNWNDSSAKGYWSLHMGAERPVARRPILIKLSQDDLDAVFQPPEEVEDRPSRGPRAEKMAQVVAAMRSEIESGKITQEGLRKEKEKVLAGRYGVSRDTVRKARKSVLSVGAVPKPKSKLSKPESKLSKSD